ncbi:MAG: hypothetical protein ACHWZW_07305 [Spirulina sp.]
MAINAADALTLEACLIALAKLETALPADLHHQVQDLGAALEAKDPEAVDRLRQVVTRHEDLNQHYEVARLALEDQYHHQRQAKTWPPEDPNHAAAATRALEAMAVPILQSDDFRETAHHLLKEQGMHKPAQAELWPFMRTLKRTVTSLDWPSVRMMKELERQPATPEHLSHSLRLGLDQVQRMALRLRNNGYISPLTTGFFDMVLPLFGVYPHKAARLDDQTFLTLTAKGYFKLNPVIVFHRHQG